MRRLCLLLLVMATASRANAQYGRRGGGYDGAGCQFGIQDDGFWFAPAFAGNPPYDGRVTFARIKYRGTYRCNFMGPGWHHDYPRAESHFMRILKEISSIDPFTDAGKIIGGAIVTLDDPALFSYPIAYVSEPGGLNLTASEMVGLRRYIERGGFLLVDDIEGAPTPDFDNMITQWQRVFPNLKPIRLTNDHPIFNCFFNIDLSKIPPKFRVSRSPEFWGFFVDNDPTKRMLAVIDNYADISSVIGFSDRGFSMVPTNESYKLWVNYFVYALTH